MLLRNVLLCALLALAAGAEEEATQVVQGVAVAEPGAEPADPAPAEAPLEAQARSDDAPEEDQLALASQLEERDSGGHAVHAPPSGGYSSGGHDDYGPPRPPKGSPPVPGPIPVPFAVPVRPGTVVLPKAPAGAFGGGHGGGHGAAVGGGHGAGHGVAVGGGHGRPRPVYKPKPAHGPPRYRPRPRPRPHKPRPVYGPPQPSYGPPPKPSAEYGAPSGGHAAGGHSSGGHSSGGHSSGGHSSGGHSSGGHSSGGHSSGGHSSGGHGDSHSSGTVASGAYVAPPPQQYEDGGHDAGHGGGHNAGHGGGESYSAPADDYSAPQPSYAAQVQPQQSYSEPQQSYSEPQQTYDAPEQTYDAPQETYDAPQQTYDAPQQTYDAPQQSYEAPAHPEQTYDAPPSHQVAEQYGAPEAQAQVSYQTPEQPAEEYGAPAGQYQPAPQDGYGAPAAPQDNYGAPAAPQAGGYGGGAEVWPVPAADMPRIVSLDVQCDKALMRVSVHFDKPFSGIIFSKGHYSNYDCVHLQAGSNSAHAQFDVSINSCGTTGNSDSGHGGYGADTGTFFENTIIIQYDPQVQEVWDQARKLRCTWHNQYEKAVTFRPFPVDMLDVVRADFAGDNVGCWMQIQVGKGPWAAEVSGLVKIGQTMTMVLAIKDDDNKFDMLVRNCVAHDGKRAPIQLVDQAGCITRPKLMSKFTKIKNFGASASVLSYAHFQAFKFPDSMEVHFQCTIQICRYQCSEQCGQQDKGGYDAPHRQRRSADEARDVGIDRIIQVVSTRDLAFALETPAGNDTQTVVVPVEGSEHQICMSTPGFAATLIVLLAILVISSLLSAFLCLRYRGFSGDRAAMLSSFENPIFLQKKSGQF
ncbi:AT-rich interactive domain-containing protein 1A-like [Amphibalanus amphitrite]|uniref:AT-rich interactive domain-containing protein 1A-like n=1 Tax=Amphibalanus amphitrite TaxID=1232801 RepID=UPI001C906D3D|nr:AT-rich interactive domain-containing protein 1A-like isoform X2 [Amphibalanus amphitrite]XP_043228056.1 AT-rich interactive domain-containing protein 1A-like [Amphibalanus amphitrite]